MNPYPCRRLIVSLIGLFLCTGIGAQEVDPDSGLFVEYTAALESASYRLDGPGVEIMFDGAGPANNIMVRRNGLGDALRTIRIVAWFDTRENAGPDGGEVITIVPRPDGSLHTSLQNPSVASGERFGLEDTVVYSGLWAKARATGQRISPDALLLAEFQLGEERLEIRNGELIDYLYAQGVEGLPD